MARNIYFIGTAGSGKSSMTAAFHEWLDDSEIDSVLVNLDPGVESLAYRPDIDIRDWIRLKDVMDDYGLGPNGAQVMCADLIAVNAAEISNVFETYKTKYVLVDTPGQMELFTFREASRATIEALGWEESFLVFLSDGNLVKSPNGLLSLMMLGATTQFRFSLPLINVISKSDLLSEGELDQVLERSRDPHLLNNDLLEEKDQSVVSVEIFKALESAGIFKELTPVSSQERTGFEDIYNSIQQYFEGGEDLRKD
jgi:GTPase SAR1 family protein